MFQTPRIRYAALLLIAAIFIAPAVFAQSAFDDPGSRGTSGQGGDLKPVVEKVDAGSVTLGGTAQVVVLLRNDDGKPLKTGLINLYPSSNITAAIGENQCAQAAIEPGEVCAISLSVKGLQSGRFRIEMLMRHDGRSKLLTTTIDGTIEQSGDNMQDLVSDIETIPANIDFGSLDESQTQVRALILRNKTSKPITISEIEVQAGSQAGFTAQSNCGELQTGQACVASITWSPQKRGPSSGTIIVHHTGATGVSSIELKGTYDPDEYEAATAFPSAVPGKGLLISSTEAIDFGSGVAQSSSITASLVNVGDVPLTLTDIRMTNSENGVRTESVGCRSGYVLAPLEACPLTLTWNPVREGNIVDDVQISHTGARGILVMPVRGAATRAINKDTKPITIGAPGPEAILGIRPISMSDIEGDDADLDDEVVMQSGDKTSKKKSAASSEKAAASASMTQAPQIDVRGILDGYTITSYSTRRAIVSGPGGSRVVYDGEQTVIGGVLWTIAMRPNAVEFQNGTQKVLLLFDRSLSSVNLLDAQSTGGGSMTGSGTTSTTSTSTSTQTQ